MKYKIGICFLFLLCVGAAAGSGCITGPEDSAENKTENLEAIEGLWLGSLKIQPDVELRLLFNISKAPETGFLTATLDSPDQGISGIPVEKIRYESGNLRLEALSINGIFEGILKEKGPTLEGEWKQGGATFPIVLQPTDKAPELRRPQDPVKPYPYIEEEVSFENKEGKIRLAGTLTLPKTEGPFPAVLLITGSGQQDRNEELCGHRPFLVLADYLTRRGIAVLRVDDRGIGGSSGNFSEATSEDFAEDALAGVEYLKSRKEIDSAHIGLIGHSEGGLIAPIAAGNDPDIAFLVLLAGPGLPGEEIIYLQSALIAKAEGTDSEIIAQNRLLQEKLFSVLKTEENNTLAAEKLREILKESLTNMSAEDKKNFDYSEEELEFQVQVLVSPWMRNFLSYDPKTALKEVKVPVLAINGDKDLQVPSKENLQAIEAALLAGGNENYTIKEMPGLNHLLQSANTGSPFEYATIQETISPAALQLIGDWILEQTQNLEE